MRHCRAGCVILNEPFPAGCLALSRRGRCSLVQSGARRNTCAHVSLRYPYSACCSVSQPRPPARSTARAAPSDRATGETYHVEVGGYFWNPTPDIAITSESLPGITGSRIDFVKDLGIEKSRFRQLKLVLRPATKHKFRFEYTPITYEAVGSLDRGHRVQRHPVPGDVPRRDEPGVEGVPLRLRVGLRLPRPRVRRPGARGEVHGGRSDAVERPRHGVRQGPRADSGHRRHRPRLCRRRTSRSPASSAASSCRRASTKTTAPSTSTSICTAR